MSKRCPGATAAVIRGRSIQAWAGIAGVAAKPSPHGTRPGLLVA